MKRNKMDIHGAYLIDENFLSCYVCYCTFLLLDIVCSFYVSLRLVIRLMKLSRTYVILSSL